MKRSMLILSLFGSAVFYIGATTPAQIEIHPSGSNVQLDWQGGTGIFQLEQRKDLNTSMWDFLGWPTRETTATLPRPERQAFFRIEQVSTNDFSNSQSAQSVLAQGRQIFRFDTFGDEDFWGGTLKLHLALAGTNNGGVGPGVSPKTALAAGLKVDVDALPEAVQNDIKTGKANLDDPATTLALLQLNSVVGVTGIFTNGNRLTSVGFQCALCHSTVDDSFAPGIGHRLDGWPNRDLNVGLVISLAPDLSVVTNLLQVSEATVKTVLTSWGPGKFDAELFLDGKAFQPDGRSAATLIPAAYRLSGVNLHTWTGWGSITYWNAFVANLEMHGKGRFFDPRLNDTNQFPVAARAGFANIERDPDEDLITSKLPALHLYQLSLPAPKPVAGKDFDRAAADRGDALFSGKASCNRCHSEPLWTEPSWNMHTAQEIGIDSFQADRSPDHRYRTAPLAGIFARQKGGFYHDGRFATLTDVVQHYNDTFSLQLSTSEVQDLVEYLKSL
jgi:hypothetical protein